MVDIHGELIESPLEQLERTARETKAYFQANIDKFWPVAEPKEQPKPEPKAVEVQAYIRDETWRKWKGQ